MGQKTIIEEYMDHVYRIVMVLLAVSTLAAGVIYAGLKLIGAAGFVKWSSWAAYMGACVLYAVACIWVIVGRFWA